MSRVLLAFILICGACGGGGGHGGDAAHGGDGSGSAPPLTADQIEAACISATSCDFAGPAGKCLNNLANDDTLVSEFRPDQIACLAAAGSSCTTALACIGLAITAPCAPEGTSCTGTIVHRCQNATAFETECAGGLWYDADETCVMVGSGAACGIGACTGTSGRCDGTIAHKCGGGVEQAADCAAFGEVCSSDGTVAQCVGPGPACTAPRCDGTALVRCEGGHDLRVECATLLDGGSCLTGSDGSLFCGYANDCSPSDPSTCTGNVLTSCVLGKQLTLDCRAAGYAGCNGGNCVSLQP